MKGLDSFEGAKIRQEKLPLLEQPDYRSFEKAFSSSDNVKSDTDLLDKVILSIRQVIGKKEKQEGRKLTFALQSQVGIQLKRDGVVLPVSLGEFFSTYPDFFKTGTHPYTNALTVSVL